MLSLCITRSSSSDSLLLGQRRTFYTCEISNKRKKNKIHGEVQLESHTLPAWENKELSLHVSATMCLEYKQVMDVRHATISHKQSGKCISIKQTPTIVI